MFLYIDPGTGSLLLSIIAGATMTLIYGFRGVMLKSLRLINGRKYRSHGYYPDQIVFYSEGKKYWQVFKPVLVELQNSNQNIVYLTSDATDPGLKNDFSNLESFYVGSMNKAFYVLNRLHARILITTTPQLNVLGWKKSKNVEHYSYIMHSPVDIHAYKLFAFDYYDSILCSGPHQILNLRELEKKRASKAKLLFETGCLYYDEVLEKENVNSEHVLIAPTWGDRSFLSPHCMEIIKTLCKEEITTILRPHPQSWISDKEILREIENEFGNNEYFHFDDEEDPIVSLRSAKVVICDKNSGIVFDNIMINQKPVIAIDFEWSQAGYESYQLSSKISSFELLKIGGKVITSSEINSIAIEVKSLFNVNLGSIESDSYVFNFRRAGKVAAKQLTELNKLLIQ
jgi:hypothetical protein